jgi:hypothetical protein
MQNRYTGDIGDFGKLGLLRALCGQNNSSRLSLGVVWYLVKNESHNEDGKYINYLLDLDDSKQLRCCDSELYDVLRSRLVANDAVLSERRDVATIESAGILPNETRYFNDAIDYNGIFNWKERRTIRHKWLNSALSETAGTDMVFLDPDNGIESRSVSRTAGKGPKFAFWDEIEAFARRNQTLVVYHHLSRSCKSEDQVRKIRQQFETRLRAFTILDLVFMRGSRRAYFIAAAPGHREAVTRRLNDMLTTPWTNHFKRFA